MICTTSLLIANNVDVTNVSLSDKNTTEDYQLINFNISWDNSWNINGGSQNHDAAWIFVKWRDKTETTWHHATLHYVNGTGSGDGHTEPANCNIKSSNDTGSGGAHGVFIHRTDLGQGTVSYTGVQLRWDYGSDGLADGDPVEVYVMAIEMVYVPQSSFYVGSGGTEFGAFYTHPTTTNPYQITSEAAITVGTAAGNLYYAGIGFSGDQLGPIPAAFPKGYNDFYCMKYEITQSQYVAFLNMLTYAQQVTRTAVLPTSAAGTAAMTTGTLNRNGIDIMTPGVASTTPAVYACNLDNDGGYNEANDGQSIACNWLSWADVAAYLAWAALRPMTELEFEKAGRGNKVAVANEYAWGNTTITGATSITNSGFNNEIAQVGSNCTYNSAPGVQGPMRSGTFAQAATTRSSSGASYYGIMELSGNLLERPVTVGNPTGRLFTGLHGNGALTGSGNANTAAWPDIDAIGVGVRGGSWISVVIDLRLSHREAAAYTNVNRSINDGGRGCRLAP
ncbi:MAG: SUMF1/EgtB/PvdO family nonheme iron enzyme [Saprospiraceae bacterium]|nr:SUMF1/EgtB/PvdO family nonheme iron enzyme [Saprospiraceae bacterium]